MTKEYQVEFPLFDRARIYLAQHLGENDRARQLQSIMKENSMIRDFKSFLNDNAQKIDDSTTVLRFVDLLIDESVALLNDLSKTSTMLRAGKLFVNLIDDEIKNRKETARKNGDTEYGELVNKLDELNQGNDDAEAIEKLLPRLFAKDISYWLTKHNTNLIVIFDAYEKLTGVETGGDSDEPVDWWVGELLAADRVMWIVTSKYDISEIGDVDFESDQVEKYTLGIFDKNWSNKYLQEIGGINEDELRTAIIKASGGHPYYLRKSVDIYKTFQLRGEVPCPDDFGKNHNEIINRLLGSVE